MNFKYLVVLLLASLLAACAESPHSGQAPQSQSLSQPPRVEKDWLSENHARLRHAQVDNVIYTLQLDLTEKHQFRGSNLIRFDNRKLSDDLTFDFSKGTVEKVWVNEAEVDFQYNGFFITLDKKHLRLGDMAVKILFRHPYSDNGSGLYRYHDKNDGKDYLYTHFEPYEANKLFPHFDQPNIRANYLLSVTAPADWHVISAVKNAKVTQQGQFKLWSFEKSELISSYVFPLHAGPYHVWQDKFDDIPLKLFARQSMAQYVDSEFWFDVTKKGLGFFNEYFAFDYPYGKYDQVIVPDFNISGMENVAAVTYTERVLSRGKRTQSQTRRVISLLLHELSHMWFGDVITIDWWSNLWLKESFATYMSNLVMEETGLSDDVWHEFYLGSKQSAYLADSRTTTHPIQMPVSDTKNGVASFDGITYRKGASALHQLTHYVGKDTFRDGIRNYFKQHAWKAAKLPDFMATLNDLTTENLELWTQQWLYTSGTNTVEVKYQCQNNQISEFLVVQTAPEQHPTLRQHSLNIGLFELGDSLHLITEKPVKISGERTTLAQFVGLKCPDMVYPNYRDWGFVKVQFDEKSRNHLVGAISKSDDPMLRNMLYQSLWDMVNDGSLSIKVYLDTVLDIVGDEDNLNVLNLVSRRLQSARRYLERFPAGSFADKQHYLQKLEIFYWQAFERADKGSDKQKLMFKGALNASHSKKAQAALIAILQGQTPEGLLLDQDLRWDILVQLARMGHSQIKKLLAAEKARDGSHNGVLAAIAVDASIPDKANKGRWLDEFDKSSQRLSAQKQKIAMENLFPTNQGALMQPFADRVLKQLVDFDVYRDQKVIGTMVGTIMPNTCDQKASAQLSGTIANNPQLGLIAMKGLKRALQSNQTCIKLRSFGR